MMEKEKIMLKVGLINEQLGLPGQVFWDKVQFSMFLIACFMQLNSVPLRF